MAFPFDIFDQLMSGNWVAWACLALFIVVVALMCGLLFLWLKLPQFAKAAFVNNTVGGNRPMILELYENRRAKFITPNLLRSGLGHTKDAWFLFPKLWATGAEELTVAERDMLNSVCTLDGTQAALYANLAIQAQVMNPLLLAVLQHEETLRAWSKPDSIVMIKKSILIEVLTKMKEDTVNLHPILNLPVDVKNLRTTLQKSLSKSELMEQENRIKDDIRHERGSGLNLQSVAILFSVISVIMSLVILLKLFGVM
jgi:hypothetical protein